MFRALHRRRFCKLNPAKQYTVLQYNFAVYCFVVFSPSVCSSFRFAFDLFLLVYIVHHILFKHFGCVCVSVISLNILLIIHQRWIVFLCNNCVCALLCFELMVYACIGVCKRVCVCVCVVVEYFPSSKPICVI